MCGISGILFAKPQIGNSPPVDLVRKMNDAMLKRGPDADGIWSDGCVALGHRRLSIQDLSSNANQPFCSKDGRFVIVFNGEIYNASELKRDLLGDQHLRTHSDTEVLIELYARYGKSMLQRLRGMFSFAIWDAQKSKLFIARDPYGIKPLYYSFERGNFIFASQVKALIYSGIIPNRPEYAGIAGFYLWGSVPEPWTIYSGILSLPAGYYLEVGPGEQLKEPLPWLDFAKYWQQEENISNQEASRVIGSAVKDSIGAHLISDVPVGLFLSGGIDSGVIAKTLSSIGVNTTGVTIAFNEFLNKSEDEVPVAKAIANKYGINHHIKLVSKYEFLEDLPLILADMDQPSVDGINSWYASKAASDCQLKVMLSGVGGDELFCGYPSFSQIPLFLRIKEFARFKIGPIIKFAESRGFLDKFHPKYKSSAEYLDSLEGLYFLKRCIFFPHELAEIMGAENACIGLAKLGGVTTKSSHKFMSNIAAISYVETTQYLRNQLLRDSDWASMSHSIELRTPLVDVQLLKSVSPYIHKFSRGIGKSMLAGDLYAGIEGSLCSKKKTGFSMPTENWMREILIDQGLINKSKNSQDQWSKSWVKFIASKTIKF